MSSPSPIATSFKPVDASLTLPASNATASLVHHSVQTGSATHNPSVRNLIERLTFIAGEVQKDYSKAEDWQDYTKATVKVLTIPGAALYPMGAFSKTVLLHGIDVAAMSVEKSQKIFNSTEDKPKSDEDKSSQLSDQYFFTPLSVAFASSKNVLSSGVRIFKEQTVEGVKKFAQENVTSEQLSTLEKVVNVVLIGGVVLGTSYYSAQIALYLLKTAGMGYLALRSFSMFKENKSFMQDSLKELSEKAQNLREIPEKLFTRVSNLQESLKEDFFNLDQKDRVLYVAANLAVIAATITATCYAAPVFLASSHTALSIASYAVKAAFYGYVMLHTAEIVYGSRPEAPSSPQLTAAEAMV